MDIEAKIKDAASRNTKLLQTLHETQSAISDLDTQNRYIVKMEIQARTANERLRQLERARKREMKEHESLRDSKVRRFAYKAARKTEKFEAKASKEELEYIEALREEEQAATLATHLDGVLEDAKEACHELQVKYTVHLAAQRDLDALYDSIFHEPSGFAEEDTLKSEQAQAALVHREAQARAEAEMQAANILREAQLRLNSALKAMDSALRRSRQDMYGGGTYTDMMERNALSQADRDIHDARALVAQARGISPLVRALPSVSIAQGNVLGDVVFDNVFSDMQFHDKIKQSLLEVQGCVQALDADLQAATHRCQELSRETDARKAALLEVKTRLQKVREAIFEMFGPAPPVGVPPAAGHRPKHSDASQDNWWES